MPLVDRRRGRDRAATRPTSSSISRTSPCSARSSGSRSRVACSRGACRTSGPTSGSILPSGCRSSCRRSRSSVPGSASGRRRSRAISRGCSRPTASVVVVAMGRGGPPEPEVITVPPTVDALVELSRSGRHAASDHLETAALVGRRDGRLSSVRRRPRGRCRDARTSRRARASPPGSTPISSCSTEAALRCRRSPPDRTVVVVGGHQDPAVAAGYLNAYRLLARRPRRRDDGRAGLGLGARARRASPASSRPGVPVVATDAATASARGRQRSVGRVLLRCARRTRTRISPTHLEDVHGARCRPRLGQSRRPRGAPRRARRASTRRSISSS